MNKKKWALLVLIALSIFGWYKFFDKTYATSTVAQSADAIVAIDVKRITNTIIWQFITTPSQWKISTSQSSKKDSNISWKDVIELPDYILAFHIKNQPNNVWHAKFTIKKNEQIDKVLKQYNFKPVSNNLYINEEMGLTIFYMDNQLLISSGKATNGVYSKQTIEELFTQKRYIAKETLDKLINAKSHLALLFGNTTFLQGDAVVKANFDKEKIEITSSLMPKANYLFTETNFSFSTNGLFALNFTQPTPSVYALLDSGTKQKISKAINFNSDSLFLASNKNYTININNFVNRVDSAITYTYDEEFNKIEKVIVNNVQEPVFNFIINGDSVNKIYSYWQQAKVIEQTPNGNLFTAMPFVKSYCTINNNNLIIKPTNFTALQSDANFNGIFYLQILLSKVPENLLNYLSDDITKAMSNIELVKLSAQQKNGAVVLNGVFQKKKNDLPIVNF